ncbi:MAG TPA: gas vesicle protein K [Vulgatibacter sp.]|nr:gas vesicle protein K [Vulgatibacter sp.]
MNVQGEARDLERLVEALEPTRTPRVELDEENVQRGLVRLVLAVVELLRQLLERQALRRIDAGTLDDEQIERLGITFVRLDEQMKALQEQFELTDEDLNLDLGPLGTTLGERSES